MSNTRTHLDRLSEQVMQTYLRHPPLVETLLGRMGALDLNVRHNCIRSTCPLHGGDGAANFAVFLDRDIPIYTCFSKRCVGSGNPLTTIGMRKYGMTYVNSVIWLAQLAGLNVQGMDFSLTPQVVDEEGVDEWAERMGLRRRAVTKVFPEWMVQQSMQMSHPLFTSRGFHPSLLAAWEVGYVPGRTWWWPVIDQGTGSPVIERDGRPRMVGWFRDMVSIPVRDPAGRLIGFYGRDPNYDPETSFGPKYQAIDGTDRNITLYGIHHERTRDAIRASSQVIVVEGFSDVWRAWSHGIFNVCAPMGTHLSVEQVKIISQSGATNAVFYMDGDDAGRLAALAMARQIQDVMSAKVASCPDGKDPGDIAVREEFLEPILNTQEIVK